MSYTVEIKTLPIDSAMGRNMTEGLGVTTFAGGENGRCVQLSPNNECFVQLDMKQLKKLRKILKHAQKESLFSYPKEV